MMVKKKARNNGVVFRLDHNRSQFDAGRTKNANKQNHERSIFSKPNE